MLATGIPAPDERRWVSIMKTVIRASCCMIALGVVAAPVCSLAQNTNTAVSGAQLLALTEQSLDAEFSTAPGFEKKGLREAPELLTAYVKANPNDHDTRNRTLGLALKWANIETQNSVLHGVPFDTPTAIFHKVARQTRWAWFTLRELGLFQSLSQAKAIELLGRPVLLRPNSLLWSVDTPLHAGVSLNGSLTTNDEVKIETK